MPPIELADQRHSKELGDLSRACPMEGSIGVYTDRGEDFLRLYHLLDKNASLYINIDQGQIDGCLGVARQEVVLQGKAQTIGFIGDLKIDPSKRGGSIMLGMMRHLIEQEKKRGTHFLLASILDGNHAGLRALHRPGMPPAKFLGQTVSSNIVPLFKVKSPTQYTVKRATADDKSELVALYNQYHQNFELAPSISEKEFDLRLDQFPGLSLDQFWVAKREGRIEAMLCTWDQKDIQQYVVTRFDPLTRSLIKGLKILSQFVPIPALPELGRPLSFFYLWMVAVRGDQPEALRAILVELNNRYRSKNYSYFTLYLPQGHPLQAAVRGFVHSDIKSNIYAITVTDHDDLKHLVGDKKFYFVEFATLI